jgi:hypothetical protein
MSDPGREGTLMDKDVVELLSKLFTPKVTLFILLVLGIIGTLYTAIIKFLFDRRLKHFEGDHAVELAKVQGHLSAETQVLVQDLQTKSARALKELEAELTRKTQAELQKSQAVITEAQAEQQSRREYQYEARKRLYHECEPLIFELLESSENAGDRIRSLARSARQGSLLAWLSRNEYYMASTMYYLLVPVAVYKLMRRRLTVVDMTLDQNTATHYLLAKRLAWSFTDDFDLAWGLHVIELEYEPNNVEWRKLRVENPAKYWRQGLPYGRLDNAVESLIIRDHEPDGYLRIMSFGQFESALHTPASGVCERFAIVQDIFTNFHPMTRPVLWRMLIAQAHIYDAIVHFHRDQPLNGDLMVVPIRAEDRPPFYWKRNDTETEQLQMEEPFTVAETYLQKNLPALFRPLSVQPL